MFSFNFAPKGWALANGQQLPINQNQALFSLLGTTYGGNGATTFALPNLQGSVPVHMGNGFALGQRGGQASVTLAMQQMPTHQHLLQAVNATAELVMPQEHAQLAKSNSSSYGEVGSPGADLVAMHPLALGNVGGSQPHENRQPILALNFCIALQGIFPSPN